MALHENPLIMHEFSPPSKHYDSPALQACRRRLRLIAASYWLLETGRIQHSIARHYSELGIRVAKPRETRDPVAHCRATYWHQERSIEFSFVFAADLMQLAPDYVYRSTRRLQPPALG